MMRRLAHGTCEVTPLDGGCCRLNLPTPVTVGASASLPGGGRAEGVMTLQQVFARQIMAAQAAGAILAPPPRAGSQKGDQRATLP